MVGVKHVQLQNVVHYLMPVLLNNFEVDIKHVYVIRSSSEKACIFPS